MPKRPIQHQLEDTSRSKFKLILPQVWVCRDKEKDYGIDCEVEIFDKNNNALGFVFWVQLKASDSKDRSKVLNIDIEIDTLKYYKSLDIPVLLARYSHFENTFYVKWVNNVDFFYAKENSKTLRIKFTENDKFDDKSANEIHSHLNKIRLLKTGKFNFPILITFDVLDAKVNNINKNIIISQIRKEFNNYSDFIRYEGLKENSLINITLDKKELVINIQDLFGTIYHNIKHRPENSLSIDIAKDILLGIAIGMLHIGHVEYCGRIIFDCKLESKLIERKDQFIYVISALFKSSYFEKVLGFLTPILDNPELFDIEILTKVNLLLNSKSKIESINVAIEDFLLNRLSQSIKTQNKQQIGISNYNLGNHYKSRKLYKLAIKHYLDAKRFASIYLNQHYYFSELAGLFFLIGRFKCSTKLYYNSIKLGATTKIKALYADALMFSGNYSESVINFNEYIKNNENPNSEFVLKAKCLEKLLERKKIKTQIRNSIEANKLAEIIDSKKNIDFVSKLHKSLDFDMLCDLAWFNLGILNIENKNVTDAAFCFTMCGLIQPDDIEAWVNATLYSFYQEDNLEFMSLIVKTAYSFNKDNYLEKLYSQIEINNKLDNLIEFIENIIKEIKFDNPITIRYLNEDGIFENIYENNN